MNECILNVEQDVESPLNETKEQAYEHVQHVLNRKWYIVKFPVTKHLGSFQHVVGESAYETKEESALWHFNNALEHDGLPPINELPAHTEFLEYQTPN